MNIPEWYNNINYYKLIKIFPILHKNELYSKIKIDTESYKYITSNNISEIISKIIELHINKKNINKDLLIELMGGCGGNTLSFSKYFNNIISIELSKLRYLYLQQNLELFDCNNVITMNKCAIEFCLNELSHYTPTIIFIDPPWGNNWDKCDTNYKITIDNISLEKLIKIIINKTKNNLIAIKIPKNYDIKFFFNEIKTKHNKIYIYYLKKMYIAICENF